ncbi:tubulin monoglycylase TTLL3-like [Phaenicophaeus curvirostris]|uniref:tubulin monoglycylase TTLL3-like n=1 Tax=Phaenicophaeus curvirostris TaxID=33595 RepID=UPI0037F09A48
MRLGRPVNAVLGTTGSGRQRQAGQAAPINARRHRPSVDCEQLKRARLHVKKAIKEKKIFVVQGPYPVIRSLLRARGWVEKLLPQERRVGGQPEQHNGNQEKQLEEEEEEERGDGVGEGEAVLDPQPSLGTSEPLCSPWLPVEKEEQEEEEQQNEDPDGFHNLTSRLVQNQVPYFIWTNRCSTLDCQQLHRDQVMNHYAQVTAFTTKNGLCLNLRNLPWVDQADPETFFPRCYRLGDVDDWESFLEDFHLTAARSLLQMALERAEDVVVGTEQPQKPVEGATGPRTPLHPELLEEALQICEQHLGSLVHEDIDTDPALPYVTSANWDRFLREYYRIAHEGAELAVTGAQRERCQALLQRLAEQLPQVAMEGDHNIWILKPGAKSRGRGIVCMARLEEVLQLVGNRDRRSGLADWVVQKYVERPLLIFGTKFDLRQWFLVTDWNPLTVWFYQESYVRFCSHPFSLRQLDPARHLCNVSIQKQYKLARGWHPQLPRDRIWSSQQLQAYLAQIGRADAWHQVMVPGMKAAVLAALHSTQDLVEPHKGSFELYGADFIFGEDCQPWLLEINASPTMAPSSAVTRRLCANVQRDTLRVVIDHRNDPSCSTGAFELICKEAAVPMPSYKGLKLMVKGSALRKPHLEQQHSGDKPPIPASSAPQRLVSLRPRGRATQVPKPEVPRGNLAVGGQRNHPRHPSSATPAQPQLPGYRAKSQGLPELSHPPRQPQPTLPQLNARPLPRVPVPPPRGAPNHLGGPTGLPPSSRPSRVVKLPELAPRSKNPRACLLELSPELSPMVGRQRVAPRGLQKNRDAGGQPGGHSTLPALPGATQRHPAPLHPSWAPQLCASI